MNLDLVVCPSCRTATDGRIDVRTLERTGDILSCECGRRYPVVDGVPIVMAHPHAYLRTEIATVVERELSPEVAALLVEGGPDDAPYARLLEHLSVYMDAQWGDKAEPPGELGCEALRAKLAERAQHRVDLAVELGCSVGRFVSELAMGAFHVVGVDMHAGAMRRARRILDGERVAFGRRIAGRHYQPAVVHAGDRALPESRHTLVCGDALDPPLIHGMFGRVVALNLLDSVSQPRQLLSVIDGLCARGGEVILSSPYAWQSTVMADAERIGGADPAAEVTRIFREGIELTAPYTIEEECDLAWTLRRDARSTVTYRTHYLRARKS
ncbi:MAG: methyltransferase domain-containing protein [Kofleriaceae bacterium]